MSAQVTHCADDATLARIARLERERAELLAALKAGYETFKGRRLHRERNVLGQMLEAVAKAEGK